MTNGFKGLDLIEYLKNCGWRFIRGGITEEAVIKTNPKKKKCKKAKWLSEKALQIAEKRREAKRQRRKGKIPNAEFQRIQGEIRKSSLGNNAKK